ncbi:MAG: type II secretion system F family protein [Clostridia bacterium]|nr:type II secretion system F family protein [Clostridia bacterium]
MPSYKYRVIFENGRIGRGKIMALNKSHAIESLKKENIQPITIRRMRETKKKYRRIDYTRLAKRTNANANSSGRAKKGKTKIDFNNITFKELSKIDLHPFARVNTKDIISFVNNFYILKKAKFNNVQALQAVYQGIENNTFKDVIEDVLIGVQAGEKLHTTMENYPKIFPPMFTNFVRVGEDSGTLDTALLHARDYVESSTALKKKIRKAIIPRVLQFIGINLAMIVAVIVGVPMLEQVYGMFGSSQEIPAATMALLNFANWLLANWVWLVAVIGLLVGLFVVYINTPRGKYNWDKLIITMPVIGTLLNNITVNKFFQAMLLNLRNGMRIQESLEISKSVTNNYYFLSAIESAKAASFAGESWLEPFEEKKLFKPMVSQMVSIGMKTDLSDMMEKVNEYIEMEIDESVAKFVKVLPDITYLFVGVSLIIFLITIVVPIINVYMGGFIDMPTT